MVSKTGTYRRIGVRIGERAGKRIRCLRFMEGHIPSQSPPRMSGVTFMPMEITRSVEPVWTVCSGTI